MKSLLLAASAVLVLGVGSVQAGDEAAWQGSVTLKSLPSPACDSLRFEPGQLLTSVYRARLHPGTEQKAALSMYSPRSALIIIDQSGTHNTLASTTAVPYDGFHFSDRAKVPQNSEFYTGNFKFAVKPVPTGAITATTTQVTVTGTITNFFSTPGCTATIEGSYFRRS
jgi:hypothetical protein